MNKNLMIALALAAMSTAPAFATAPNASYVQVQTSTGTEATTPGAAVDNAAAATGAAANDAAAATGAAATTAGNAVNDAVDPNKSVDTNNDGVADTRQFPWGLLGLIGLAGLLGRNRPAPVVLADTARRDSVSGLGISTRDRRWTRQR